MYSLKLSLVVAASRSATSAPFEISAHRTTRRHARARQSQLIEELPCVAGDLVPDVPAVCRELFSSVQVNVSDHLEVFPHPNLGEVLDKPR